MNDQAGRYQLPRGPVDRELTLRGVLLGSSPAVRRICAASVSPVIDVEIAPPVLSLDEVVVTGTAGLTRVREVGHGIAQITPARIPEPVISIDNMLAGKVPGMSVLQAGFFFSRLPAAITATLVCDWWRSRHVLFPFKCSSLCLGVSVSS